MLQLLNSKYVFNYLNLKLKEKQTKLKKKLPEILFYLF